MVRVARGKLLYEGCLTHVFSRSIEKRKIFKEDSDFEFFKGLLLETKKTYHFKIHHYCLMHTHFHMAVRISDTEEFSQGLRQIKRKYTHYFNKAHKRYGPLWQGRFKSLLIENEEYLYACGLYIENNPVKAGIIRVSEDWPYSSSRYFQKQKQDELVDGYEKRSLPTDINLKDDEFFTRGIGVGSSLFKFYLKEDIDIAQVSPF